MTKKQELIDYVIGNEFITKPILQNRFIMLLNEALAEQLTLTDVVVPKGMFNCGQERVFGGGRCKEQCDDCVFEYQDN
jgi:hypothetical protein